MSKPDVYIVGCTRVTPQVVPVARSVPKGCQRCGHPVWVAPTSFARAADDGVQLATVCLQCLTPQELTAMGMVAPTPAQIIELHEHWSATGQRP